MSPTATYEDIKAYQDKVEKDEIKPYGLPPCPVCKAESEAFKIHAYRERRFLIIVEMIVRSVYSALIRFKCPCGKTVTYYPDFALPRKHYTRQTIMGFAQSYVASEEISYEKAVRVEEEDGGVPEYPDGKKSLAPSTVHRWVTSLSRLKETTRTALDLIRQEDPATIACRALAQMTIPPSKYRSESRMERLLGCLRLLVVEGFFKAVFQLSIFTELARATGFT
jgi:Domain of unknown function (DUF6431)